MSNYNDGKWHGWNGGECPVHPETVVEVSVADTKPYIAKSPAKEWSWSDADAPIIDFRVVKEYKEPREWWVAIRDGEAIDIASKKSTLQGYSYGAVIHVREVIE